MGVAGVPAGEGEVIVVWSSVQTEFALYDLAGQLITKENLGLSASVWVTDADGDGTAEFLLMGPSGAACYELRSR